MSYLFGKDQFLWKYKKLPIEQKRRVWIIVHLSDGSDIYLEEYEDWLTMGEYCNSNKLTINSISLQYKSHIVNHNTMGADGVYLSKTAKGSIGGETKHCFSIGVVKNQKIYRTLYTTPELIEDFKLTDDIENCLKEALILYEKAR